MAQGRVIPFHTVKKVYSNNWKLCFQYGRFDYGDGDEEKGYRFMWETPDGKLRALRGGARIPSIADILELTSKAINEGWGHHLGDMEVCDREED